MEAAEDVRCGRHGVTLAGEHGRGWRFSDAIARRSGVLQTRAMWRTRPDDPVDGIRRQVGRVRARRNGWVAQRALYQVVALGAVAAALLLLVALLASPIVFAAALVATALALVGMTVRIGTTAGRAWVLEHADVHHETARLAQLIVDVAS